MVWINVCDMFSPWAASIALSFHPRILNEFPRIQNTRCGLDSDHIHIKHFAFDVGVYHD